MTQAVPEQYSLTGWVDVCSWPGVGDTHHFLIRELPSLDAATVSHCLLVPLALGVAEQVHLWGDLQTQTRWSEVTAVDTMETEAGKGQQSPMGHWWNNIPYELLGRTWPASSETSVNSKSWEKKMWLVTQVTSCGYTDTFIVVFHCIYFFNRTFNITDRTCPTM